MGDFVDVNESLAYINNDNYAVILHVLDGTHFVLSTFYNEETATI